MTMTLTTSPSLNRHSEAEEVSGYRFQVSDLRTADREPGVSAFMRIKNGADWLEVSIRSHIDFFDEIVAVYNQCTDATPEILNRLQQEYGPKKLRVIHYLDPVFPPGSDGHARTDPGSPNSLVNYYNFSLASTRYRYATKLDDDHLAIVESTRAITNAIRSEQVSPKTMFCFSGLNLFRDADGRVGILDSDSVSGSGDIGFFRVTPQTYFTHDRRFERFQRGGARRVFAGFLYWHLKYIKRDMGFGNYDLDRNPQSRYAKKHEALKRRTGRCIDPHQLAMLRKPTLFSRISGLVSGKAALIYVRDSAIPSAFPDESVESAILRTVSPEFRSSLVPREISDPYKQTP